MEVSHIPFCSINPGDMLEVKYSHRNSETKVDITSNHVHRTIYTLNQRETSMHPHYNDILDCLFDTIQGTWLLALYQTKPNPFKPHHATPLCHLQHFRVDMFNVNFIFNKINLKGSLREIPYIFLIL